MSDDPLLDLIEKAVPFDELREPRRFGEPDSDNDVLEEEDGDDDVDACDDDEVQVPPEVAAAEGRTSGPQTGIKSVLADKKYSDRKQSEQKQENQRKLMEKIGKNSIVLRTLDNDDDDDDDALFRELEEGEDSFTKEYRAKRMFEMREQVQNRPVFGTLPTVSEEGFLVAVEKENPLVPVIVHVFDNRSSDSRRMSICLAELSLRYAHAKFVCFGAKSAGFDLAVLPVLLVYQRGDLIKSLVHTNDETGDNFTVDSVEGLLLGHGVLSAAYKTTDPDLESRLRNAQTEAHGTLSLTQAKEPSYFDNDDDD